MMFQGSFFYARFLCAASFIFVSAGVFAQDAKPLSLERALKAADAPHPDLQLAEAERDLALSDQELASARSDLSVTLEGRLQGAQSAFPGADFNADNSLRLLARKNLFDFGRSENSVGAARAVTEARDRSLLEARDQRRIDIMARFFDVLMADLRYVADSEFMTVAYLNFDRGRDQYNQKLLSKVDLSELEARFQNLLVKRNESQLQQRLTRELLADAMNQPGQLVSDLDDPKLPGNERALPSYETLSALVEQSPKIQSSKKLLEASRQRLEALRAENRPFLDAEVEANDYVDRRLPGRDALRAGVVLSWPIYQGNRNSAQMEHEQAQFHKLQAEAEITKRKVSQAILKLLIEAEQLQKTARNAAKVQADYRDLALDRARAQYEVELKTNLGESAAFTMEAKLRQRSVEYQLALTLAKLEALLGQPLPKPDKK
jgi:outer membrane protein TolC